MMTNFFDILSRAAKKTNIKVVVAAAQDSHVLKAVHNAYKAGIADAILVGNKEDIRRCMEECHIPKDIFEIEDVQGDTTEQSKRAVELVVAGKGHILMKGLVETSTILRAVLKEPALKTGRTMSAVSIMETKNYHKLLMITDPAMNIRPDLMAKKQLIENALEVTNALNIDNPKVAVLCAKEKADDKMPETIDAVSLKELNIQGELTGCIVDGPFALDNIISKEAAERKGINSPVAGDADIILCHELVAANSLYKSMLYLGDAKAAATIMGAKVPIVVTSRADSEETKLNSIAVAVLLA